MLYLVEKVPIYITNKGGSRRRKKVINAERERERERETERETEREIEWVCVRQTEKIYVKLGVRNEGQTNR